MKLQKTFQEIEAAIRSCPKELRHGQYVCNLFLTDTGFRHPDSQGWETSKLFYCSNHEFWAVAPEFFTLD